MMTDETVAVKKRGCGFYALAGVGVLVGLTVLGAIIGPDAEEVAATKQQAAQESLVTARNVTADELFRAFERNEVAAKAEYGDQPLLITGTIDSISLDFSDEPVVNLQTSNQFQSAQLDFDEGDAAMVGQLGKGQKITALCTELTEVIGTPMLDNCSIP